MRRTILCLAAWAVACGLNLHPTPVHAATKKKLVLIAGTPSHGPGDHEFNAGCLLIKKCLQNVPDLEVVTHLNGWPKDESILKGANGIFIFSDGGGGHPAIKPERLGLLGQLIDKGAGLGCAHYAVEVPKDKGGPEFLEWIGGYFEAYWSVNPHWTADFKNLPQHEITRGVKPFGIRDEWYYHMRFRPNMEGVTPILTAVPPDSTRGKEGAREPHGGNPDVFARKGMPEHVMWTYERPDGGRGFGFTGGHYHANWGNEDFRKVVLNALLWICKMEVPANGVVSTVTAAELAENLDPKGGKAPRAPAPAASVKAKFKSELVKGTAIPVDVDIAGAKGLWLVVTDGGDGFGCDWADWAEPRLGKRDGTETKLTDMKWKSASSGHRQASVNKNVGGEALRIAGKPVAYGIGTHAPSVIEYDIAGRDFVRFKATAGLDNGGTDQGCGSTVQFLVFTEKPDAAIAASSAPAKAAASTRGTGPEAARDDLKTMQVADGVAVTLFASEPMFVNPADIDVDARGRVWVTEGANYRRWNNPPLRPEGDRIVILEDTNHDGAADVAKTFYQDPTVNAALGIGVFGNRVIVSSGPHVFVLTDTDGDDKADKRELMFTGISGNQHDHGIHAFVFGPDGKLYFNFGNAGEQLKYPVDFKACPLQGAIPKIQTKPVVDMAGNEVAGRGKPYRQGMVFRCNMDGTEVETLGWNFRNNYEVCVDSFGNMWQSDNDDDGNRGVRINYVMEYGNYGFTDEMTGAGWTRGWDKAKAKGVPESEKPAYHWHQSDPGVVPNLLHTGAGSPTGILFYEGTLLPGAFRNQIIHCDAGPRVTRGYQVENDGAGFRAEITNLLTSTDSWYRPSDVCAGPDGAVYVADWNDPGVGGHAMGDNDTTTMRGRIYRLAPPNHKPSAPQLKLDTAAGCAEALQSPNMATRYLAWTKLRDMGPQSESELLKLWRGKDPSQRARAVQLLARSPSSDKYIQEAIKDPDANIRIVGLRMARSLRRDVISIVKVLAQDSSPQVRRECALALRHNPHAESPGVWADLAPHAGAPKLWAILAQQHDGRDRWYLEALGIAAYGHEDLFFNAWLNQVGEKWNTPAGRDIIWRSRSTKVPSYLVKIITDKSTKDPERYLRSLDFIRGPEKEAALLELITAGTQ